MSGDKKFNPLEWTTQYWQSKHGHVDSKSLADFATAYLLKHDAEEEHATEFDWVPLFRALAYSVKLDTTENVPERTRNLLVGASLVSLVKTSEDAPGGQTSYSWDKRVFESVVLGLKATSGETRAYLPVKIFPIAEIIKWGYLRLLGPVCATLDKKNHDEVVMFLIESLVAIGQLPPSHMTDAWLKVTAPMRPVSPSCVRAVYQICLDPFRANANAMVAVRMLGLAPAGIIDDLAANAFFAEYLEALASKIAESHGIRPKIAQSRGARSELDLVCAYPNLTNALRGASTTTFDNAALIVAVAEQKFDFRVPENGSAAHLVVSDKFRAVAVVLASVCERVRRKSPSARANPAVCAILPVTLVLDEFVVHTTVQNKHALDTALYCALKCAQAREVISDEPSHMPMNALTADPSVSDIANALLKCTGDDKISTNRNFEPQEGPAFWLDAGEQTEKEPLVLGASCDGCEDWVLHGFVYTTDGVAFVARFNTSPSDHRIVEISGDKMVLLHRDQPTAQFVSILRMYSRTQRSNRYPMIAHDAKSRPYITQQGPQTTRIAGVPTQSQYVEYKDHKSAPRPHLARSDLGHSHVRDDGLESRRNGHRRKQFYPHRNH